jgi:copper homeostasis protein
LDSLIELGFDRILTSGVHWGMPGSALDGVLELDRVIQAAQARLEIVIAGGVNPVNAPQVLQGLSPWNGRLSVHAYSGVQDNGNTTDAGVRALVEAVAGF